MSGGDCFTVQGRIRSFRDAFRGVLSLVSSEPNAWIHALASASVLVLGSVLGLGRLEWALLVLAMAGVWAAEAMNTAVESLADRVSPDPHPLVGRAKDVAAAGVLLAAIGAAVVGFLVLGPPLWALLVGD